ncbi:DUF4410 domain-containing protein [Thalassospira mesophila]|uniref:DUF4410 domain-containing protein n=1 Tax=Thalassospira mesophila TaxID=1293891 RepID=A0A1Y2L2S5_9PROT|nr:DUF4410 domain-containing protein [Thalassospira mesophila]OSQ38872.1 hypothetical protein TMES_08990 [Thalassospira mesophila]
MKARIFGIFACLVLGACSTAIETRTAMPEDIQHNLAVDDVLVTAPSTDIEKAVLERLKTAVEQGFAAEVKGAKPVHVNITVNDFKVQSGAGRFFLGALMGANHMDVSVQVTDDAGVELAVFDVRREANPGGLGAFYSQTNATIDETAKGVVAAVMGRPVDEEKKKS